MSIIARLSADASAGDDAAVLRAYAGRLFRGFLENGVEQFEEDLLDAFLLCGHARHDLVTAVEAEGDL
jgi:hypothetical protein